MLSKLIDVQHNDVYTQVPIFNVKLVYIMLTMLKYKIFFNKSFLFKEAAFRLSLHHHINGYSVYNPHRKS